MPRVQGWGTGGDPIRHVGVSRGGLVLRSMRLIPIDVSLLKRVAKQHDSPTGGFFAKGVFFFLNDIVPRRDEFRGSFFVEGQGWKEEGGVSRMNDFFDIFRSRSDPQTWSAFGDGKGTGPTIVVSDREKRSWLHAFVRE